MSAITVLIYLVNGGLQEKEVSETAVFLQKLRWLESQGFTNKQLIHHLITDDWGVPPKFVEISGKDLHGKRLEIRIPYI